jgi:hypothetical protein
VVHEVTQRHAADVLEGLFALLTDAALHLEGKEVEPDLNGALGHDTVEELDVFGVTSELLVDLDDL